MPTLGFGVPDSQLLRYASTLTIEELTGTGEGGPRKVILRGPSMPFMGAEWGGGNNLITTFYAGNPVGSQQNMGPKELPSAWQGEWNRTLLGKVPVLFTDESGAENLVIRPDLVWDVIEDVYRRGALLRVTWATHGSELIGDFDQTLRVINVTRVREGRAKDWKFQPDRHSDIKWSVTFDWISRGGQQLRNADVREDQDVIKGANALENSIALTQFLMNARARQLKPNVRLSASHLTLGQLESIADLPKKTVEQYTRKLQVVVNDLKRAGNIANKFRNAPYAAANTAVDFARNTLAIANQFADTMGRSPPEKLTLKRKVSDMMRAWQYTARIREVSAINARLAQEIIDRTRRFVVAAGGEGKLHAHDTTTTRAGDVLGTYITKTGDTPQSVSMRFYNTPDRGLDILQANRLPWHTPTFDRGKILIIPRLAATRT